jgi:DNA-binding LacI/PurR family transcriptional regulator
MEFAKLDVENPRLLYQQLADIIIGKISSNEIAVGNRIPPERELCKTFGVSLDTVRDALSNLVRDGYIARKRKLGTFVINSEPRKTKSLNAINEIGIIVSPYETSMKTYPQVYIERVIKGIEEKVRENGTYLMYSTIKNNKLSISGKEKDISGLILTGDITPGVFRTVRGAGIPFVCIGDVRRKTGPAVQEADIIAADDFKGTYLATRFLLARGHKKIVFIYQSQDYPWDREELRGYIEAHREAGIECRRELQVRAKDLGTDGGYTTIRNILDNPLSFTGIVNVADSFNMGILMVLREKGLRVPEDVEVASIGGISELPSVRLVIDNWEEMGRKAAERIIERIKNPDLKPERIIVPFKTAIQDSVNH